MRTELQNVKVLIWDFDGTLYPPNQRLWQDVREAEYQTVINHTAWPREKVVEEFGRLHKKVIPSATQVAACLSGISVAEAAVEMEQYFDRRKYITRDEKLIELFRKLKHFRHFTLANGVVEKHRAALAVLGVPQDTFEEMVTSETVGITKPSEKGFLYILEKTKLAPAYHLMIGDREEVDIVPAKRLGLKTCLVWSSQSGSVADVVLPTVYDVAKILKVDPIKEE